MKLKKILCIVILIILCSGCSSKNALNRWGYNWLQNDKFCTNIKEYDYKRLHSHEYNQDGKMSYDAYRKM